MKHRFNLWYDLLLPILNKIVGKNTDVVEKSKTVTDVVSKTDIRSLMFGNERRDNMSEAIQITFIICATIIILAIIGRVKK